ncbi:MAG: T9SS type A sorting domain-containing protein, partial [candidate division Zixibacteria bacterium]|nr:T9SS type A sorting domain-containing protein [candidate division Zixibacteria bacterium]
RSGFTFTPGTRSYNSIQNNFSSQNFTATDIGDPEITLNRPNGGEFFNIGTVEEIQWSAIDNEDEVQSVSIYLSRDNGSNYSLIASNEENDGVYDYSVTAPNSDVCKVYVIAYDNSGNFSADTTDGVFSIGTDVYEIEGRVSYFSTDVDLEDFDVILAGNPTDSTTTNQSGNYNFTDVDPGDYTLEPYSNRRSPIGVVSAADAFALLHDIAGTDTLTGYASIAGDVNDDNLKGAYDVALIARYSIGDIDDSWAYTWTFVPSSYNMTPDNWDQAPDHIEYSPLNANMYNQDFKGIVAGDVTGNFDGFGLFTQYDFPEKRNKPHETADPLDVILVNIGDTTVCNVGFVWIPVILDNTNGYDVYSLDGTLRYDPDVLSPDTATADSCVSSLWEYKIFFSGGPGMVRFVAAGSTPLEAGGYLIRIGFRINDSTSTAYSDIAIDSLSLNDDYVPSEVSNGSVSICPVGVDDETGIPSSFNLEGNYPNPFNPSTTIRFNVPDNGYVDFDVYNLLGQAIYNRNDLRVQPGSNDIEFSSPSLGSGLYYYRIKYGDEFKIGKMLLLK